MQAQRKETGKHTVFIVDDHPLICESLSILIQSTKDLVLCGRAETYRESLLQIEKQQPDVAVVDISLEGVSGIELTRALKQRSPKTRVLILSASDEFIYAAKCLKAGACGYIMKTKPLPYVLEGIRTVLKGEFFLSSSLTSHIVRGLVDDHPAAMTSVVELLTDRELEVFRLIGQGIVTGRIAELLSVSPKTIQTYREKIKEKLGLSGSAELSQKAVQWLLVNSDTPAENTQKA